MLKAGFRHDNAPMAIIEFIDRDEAARGQDSGPVDVEAEAKPDLRPESARLDEIGRQRCRPFVSGRYVP